MENPRAVVGRRIRLRREQLRLSQREVAHRAGVSPGFLASVETGRANATIDSLHAILKTLGMEFEEAFVRVDAGSVADPTPGPRLSQHVLSVAREIEELPNPERAAALALLRTLLRFRDAVRSKRARKR